MLSGAKRQHSRPYRAALALTSRHWRSWSHHPGSRPRRLFRQ